MSAIHNSDVKQPRGIIFLISSTDGSYYYGLTFRKACNYLSEILSHMTVSPASRYFSSIPKERLSIRTISEHLNVSKKELQIIKNAIIAPHIGRPGCLNDTMSGIRPPTLYRRTRHEELKTAGRCDVCNIRMTQSSLRRHLKSANHLLASANIHSM